MTGQLLNLAVEIVDLLLDGLARIEQRPHRGDQLGTPLNQLLGTYSEDIDLARPMTRPKFLSRPRTWFSRSRLILTSNARLASSALTRYVQSQMKWYADQSQEFGRLMARALTDLRKAQS